MKNKNTLIVGMVLVLWGVTARLLPHPANFAPIAAIALFSAVYLSQRWALLVPVVAMMIGDYFVGFYTWPLMLAVYGSFILVGLIGWWVKRNKSFSTVISGSLLGSVVFFLVTNFAVWALSGWYAKTLVGLGQAYIMALPFFRNTLLGDLFYVGLTFGIYELVKLWLERRVLVKQGI